MYLKVQLSYARTEETALDGAYDQWRTNIFQSQVLADLRSPQQFDAAADFIKPQDMHEFVRISANPQKHIEWLQKDIELGFETISLHNVNREQQRFIEVFGEKVLPALIETRQTVLPLA